MSKKRIVLGSGKTHYMEFTGELPAIDTICKDEHLLGYISGGAELEYSPSSYTASDDLGLVKKTIITDEAALFKTGVMTFDADTLDVLVSTGRVTTEGNKRTIKIGGIGNDNGKSYAICFHHVDKKDGDIWVLIVGKNKAGFTLTFQKDKETIIDAEFECEPQDEEGTLIQYIEEIKTDATTTSEQSTNTEPEEA